MSKAKKRAAKENKEAKDLSIPRIPDSIFVVELNDVVLITGFNIATCVFPHYKFDTQDQSSFKAFAAAEDIAVKQGKLIADTVELGFIDDPHIYDPLKLKAQVKRIADLILEERVRFEEAWAKLRQEEKE